MKIQQVASFKDGNGKSIREQLQAKLSQLAPTVEKTIDEQRTEFLKDLVKRFRHEQGYTFLEAIECPNKFNIVEDLREVMAGYTLRHKPSEPRINNAVVWKGDVRAVFVLDKRKSYKEFSQQWDTFKDDEVFISTITSWYNDSTISQEFNRQVRQEEAGSQDAAKPTAGSHTKQVAQKPASKPAVKAAAKKDNTDKPKAAAKKPKKEVDDELSKQLEALTAVVDRDKAEASDKTENKTVTEETVK